MRSIIFMLMLGIFSSSFGQTRGILPEIGKPEETFTEWQKITVEFDGGETATYEYRIAFSGKKALACNYEVQVKNTSTLTLKFKIVYHYYDKLVKQNFTETIEEKLKPGKALSGRVLTQGCKKEKGVERSDLEHCLSCDFYYDIKVSK